MISVKLTRPVWSCNTAGSMMRLTEITTEEMLVTTTFMIVISTGSTIRGLPLAFMLVLIGQTHPIMLLSLPRLKLITDALILQLLITRIRLPQDPALLTPLTMVAPVLSLAAIAASKQDTSRMSALSSMR